MRISEITAASEIPKISWSIDTIRAAKVVGKIDGVEVRQLLDHGHIFLIIIENELDVAYLAITKSPEIDNMHGLVRISNDGSKGLASALLAFSIFKYGSLCISPTEPLTYHGLLWLKKILVIPRGIQITTLNGKKISPKQLDAEWYAAMTSDIDGDTGLIIDIGQNLRNRIHMQESTPSDQLLQPAYIFRFPGSNIHRRG